MTKRITFHCAKPITDENGDIITKPNGKMEREPYTHTLIFTLHDDNTLLMGWGSNDSVDQYSKSEGRKYATKRLDTLEHTLSQGVIATGIDAISSKFLPMCVAKNHLEYYIARAITLLTDGKVDYMNVVFYSVEYELCSVGIEFVSSEEDQILDDEKNDDGVSDFIFATFVNEDDEVVVYVQNRKRFVDNGNTYVEEVTEKMANVLGPVMDKEGFLIIENNKPILVHEKLIEVDVVHILKNNGLGYSCILEQEILN